MNTLRWLQAHVSDYRQALAGLLMLSCVEVALRLLLPWPMMAIVDQALGSTAPSQWVLSLPGIDPGDRHSLLLGFVVLGFAIQMAHQAVLLTHSRLYSMTGLLMTRDLRRLLFEHLQSLTLRHHSATPVGDSVHRLEADASCLEQLLLRGVLPLTFSAVTLAVMFVVLATINVQLALVSMTVLPFLFLWIKWSARRIRPGAEQTRLLESRLTARLHESFAAIRLIKSFAREPYEGQRFLGAATEAMQARARLSAREAVFSSTVGTLIVMGSSVVLLVGGNLVLEGQLTVGTLLVAMAYLGFVYGPLSGIANTAGSIQQALASARRVIETLSLTPETDSPHGVSPQRLTGRIEFEDVSFAYRDRMVLRDVTFVAEPGETIALVGPSGSGKTTLVSLIARFYQPSTGRILLDGIDIATFKLSALRQLVAFVHQEPVILSGTIADNLRYGRLEASTDEVTSAAHAANADEFIVRFPSGYDTELGEGGAGLSGGQKQRLSMARAFLKDAPILILDEPTAALDTISERLVFSALRRLRTGRTTIVIAHRLSTVRDADRILVLDAGAIVAAGTHETLMMTSELYRRLAAQLPDSHTPEK